MSEHGGSLAEARRQFPEAPEPFLDLSTGINPVAYPLPEMRAEWFTRLPEAGAVAELECVAAEAYGVQDPEMVVAAPGTQILIELIPLLWPAGSVAVLGPTYGEYVRAWSRAGAAVREVGSVEGLAGADVAVVCQPNNPDGRRISPNVLMGLADRVGLLVVDEAFADLEGEGVSVAGALPHPGLIVLRSFGKTYGLAGLRLGFALTAPEWAERLRRALGPWAVSGPAIAIGSRALADRRWLAEARERLEVGAQRLDKMLEIAGLRLVGGTRLFRLAEGAQAGAVFERLGRAGIFVRRFAAHPGWLRFGQPGDEAGWERLSQALGTDGRF